MLVYRMPGLEQLGSGCKMPRGAPPSPCHRASCQALAATLLLLACVGMLWPRASFAQGALVGDFRARLEPWREVAVGKNLRKNDFALVNWDGVRAVRVDSKASMSLLARPLQVDLQKTPVLCWRWRIDAPLRNADLSQRSGDDYAARVYVSLALPDSEKSLFLRAQLGIARAIWGEDLPDAAINYVWDNRNPIGTEQPNAYTDRVTMIVLRSGAADTGRWIGERRDVGADVARLFSPAATTVQLAVTADTDNTGETARAGFADMRFVGKDDSCEGK
ncbi:MAG: DUF3047 domain-containing protein [Quisquiliibacterium sp.]